MALLLGYIKTSNSEEILKIETPQTEGGFFVVSVTKNKGIK